uniref:Uncharacterized protein n=1 Tax=Nelumbo nucifera TaxID=4432 RepID=A0A822Y4J6_NELNU|nr:TPA_asm: hypothetical protein HUJ06_028391 [Nelumbo nucifera]
MLVGRPHFRRQRRTFTHLFCRETGTPCSSLCRRRAPYSSFELLVSTEFNDHVRIVAQFLQTTPQSRAPVTVTKNLIELEPDYAMDTVFQIFMQSWGGSKT